ncbi:MAG TPA: YggT family protein [Treponema sp.]|nr:YggT family protein [Treponema sp.]
MFQPVFTALSSLVSLFSLVCLVRIVFTWIPNLDSSPVGRFLSGLCDPYLHWFKRFSFTRMGSVDFSPILGLGVLSVGAMTFANIAATGRISIGVILAGLLQVLWSFFGFFLGILGIFLFVRLVYDLIKRYEYGPFWIMLDSFLNPVISRVTRLIGRGKTFSYRASLILTFIVVLILRFGLAFAVVFLQTILMSLPV